jgi:hypothetical protein
MTSQLAVPLSILFFAATALAQWQPADTPLSTRWATDVSPDNAWPQYPRPTLQRDRWLNLNGLWDYTILSPNTIKADFDGKILVPYPVESSLSGVGRRLAPDESLVYWRTFDLPQDWRGSRILLHLEAADWHASVSVNSKQIGEHKGGYDRATFDITSALAESDTQTIRIEIRDPTDASTQPRGKQVRNPNGIWYTPTSGIWQTVWIEPVPANAIETVRFETDIDTGAVTALVTSIKDADLPTSFTVTRNGERIASTNARLGEPLTVTIPDHQLWSPDSPTLYDAEITLADDTVKTYFAFRTISVQPDAQGVTRIHLNAKPLFLIGTLDQGFWPDGLYTPPTEEAMIYDIEVTRRLGFNTIRKHVKVEPECWYAACDRLGMLVLQDMPSGDEYVRPNEGEIARTPESAAQFEHELEALIEQHRSHPSIVMWIPFNEGWGQYDTIRIVDKVKALDPTRLVNPASGWNDFPAGHVHDIHSYPGPSTPNPEPERAAFLGEFGGLGLPLDGHTWQDKDNWGYRSYDSTESLTDAYVALLRDTHRLIGDPTGLSGAIYTQTTDVEVEVNGLMTYDRAIIKLDEARVREANTSLHAPPPVVRDIAPTAAVRANRWRYTTTKPEGDWTSPDYDDSSWSEGPSGFGTSGTPGAVIGTTWNTSDIWIRRSVPLRLALSDPHLNIHHDEDAEVYFNGVLAAELTGYTTGYVLRPVTDEAAQELRKGTLLMAIHCRQTGGGQYIDAGLVNIVYPK